MKALVQKGGAGVAQFGAHLVEQVLVPGFALRYRAIDVPRDVREHILDAVIGIGDGRGDDGGAPPFRNHLGRQGIVTPQEIIHRLPISRCTRSSFGPSFAKAGWLDEIMLELLEAGRRQVTREDEIVGDAGSPEGRRG